MLTAIAVLAVRGAGMAFGKPKKVGMPKRRKTKVVAAPAVAEEVVPIESNVPAGVEASPPRAPKPEPPAAARVLPSPGKKKINHLAQLLRFAKADAMGMAKAVGDMETKFEVAKKVFNAKMKNIEKLSSRKQNPITPRQQLNRLWDAERALQKEHLAFVYMREAAALACCKARDMLIVLLEHKLKRMSRVRPCKRRNRGAGFGSPSARIKFSARW